MAALYRQNGELFVQYCMYTYVVQYSAHKHPTYIPTVFLNPAASSFVIIFIMDSIAF